MLRPREDPSATPSPVAFSAAVGEREDYKNRSETTTLKNQCIPGLAAEAKKLRKKTAEREKADTAPKTTPKGRKKLATAGNELVAALER